MEKVKLRHTVTPRVLCFIFNGDKVLFLKASKKKDWNGYYEPPGGHIEKGENPIDTAEREIFEETGLKINKIKLKGVVHVSGFYGKDVMMFVVKAQTSETNFVASSEGEPIWIDTSKLNSYKMLEDIKPILEKIMALREGEISVGVSEFDGKDKLVSFDIKVN